MAFITGLLLGMVIGVFSWLMVAAWLQAKRDHAQAPRVTSVKGA